MFIGEFGTLLKLFGNFEFGDPNNGIELDGGNFEKGKSENWLGCIELLGKSGMESNDFVWYGELLGSKSSSGKLISASLTSKNCPPIDWLVVELVDDVDVDDDVVEDMIVPLGVAVNDESDSEVLDDDDAKFESVCEISPSDTTVSEFEEDTLLLDE